MSQGGGNGMSQGGFGGYQGGGYRNPSLPNMGGMGGGGYSMDGPMMNARYQPQTSGLHPGMGIPQTQTPSLNKPLQMPGVPASNSGDGGQAWNGPMVNGRFADPHANSMLYQNFSGSPQTGGMTPAPSMQKPMMAPEFSMNAPGKIGYQPQQQQAQRQAPPGYYFREDGMMLQGQDPSAMNKVGNVYGNQPGQFGGPGYTPGSGNQQMLDIYAAQRQAAMGQAAPFGRYPDGTPMADPNTNFRANALQGRFGGGWGK